jgi:hypothetical protein
VSITDTLPGLLGFLLAAAGLVLLISTAERGARVRAWLVRTLERLTGRPDLGWLRWWHLAFVVAVGLTAVMGYDILSGFYACTVPGRTVDIVGFLAQGRAFWSGTNPFNVPDCGGMIVEPDGLAAVLINAVGSLAGIPGIVFVWGAVSVALIPLTWWVAGPERRYLTLIVATSPLYFPLVSAQIDGASNALVPVVVLLTLYLATRSEIGATGLAGFLATQRFPTLFPILALSGSFRRRFAAAFAAIAVFATGTAISYLFWRADFINVVFLDEFGRRSFSLNFWGVFLLGPGLPSGNGLEIVQALLTLVLVVVVFLTVRSPLRAAAITLTGVALLTQFLSFNILIWLLPVALVGARPRWWLWAIAVVGTVNYNYAFNILVSAQGIVWPSEVLDLVLTALLLGLLIDLWRSADPAPLKGAAGSGGSSEDSAARIITPLEVGRADEDPSPPVSLSDPTPRAVVPSATT